MSITVSLRDVQRAGFPMGGEPLVALDLADTLMLAAETPVDLLESPVQAAVWWKLQARRLPEGPDPDLVSVRRLRAAVRDLLDAHLEARDPLPTSVEDVNAAAAAVPTSTRLVVDDAGVHGEIRWHTEHGGNARLAAIAREAIALMAAPERLGRLRRCANSSCSMLFLAENKRRQWCSANVCGNRARVARHYEKQRAAGD